MQFVIFCYNFIFVVYEIHPDNFPRCLTPYSNRECFGLFQNRKFCCKSNHSALSRVITGVAFLWHKFTPHGKILSVLWSTVIRSELPGRSSMDGFSPITPKNTETDQNGVAENFDSLRDRRDTDTHFRHLFQRWCNQITKWCKSLTLEKYISYWRKCSDFFRCLFCLFLAFCF